LFFQFKLQQPKFFFTIFVWPKNLSFPQNSILVACFISTTISGPNNLSAQLARLVLFYLNSIQMPPDSDYHPLSNTATPLHPPVVPPRRNQEPSRMILFSCETGDVPYSLLPQNGSIK
jgi:hypothetical protein